MILRALALLVLLAAAPGCTRGPSAEVHLFTGEASAPTATARIGADRMSRIPLGETIVLGVPPGHRVEMPAAEPRPERSWPRRHWILTVLYAYVAIYAVAIIGVTGGPNHGEHPFLVALVHLIVFAVVGPPWDGHLYVGLLLASVVLGLVAHLLTFKATWVHWVLRAPSAALYIAMFWIIASEPDFAPRARWADEGRRAIEGYVPRRLRPATIEVRDAGGAVLATERIPEGPDRRFVYFRPAGGAEPASLRIVGPGEPEELKIQ